MVDRKYTAEELDAIDFKFEHPNFTVKCPRCGKLLIYTELASASEVRCETVNCLYDCNRGI